jgi:hypothetical protein
MQGCEEVKPAGRVEEIMQERTVVHAAEADKAGLRSSERGS